MQSRNCSDDIPSLEINDNIVSDPYEKANIFNDFFLSVSNISDSNTEIPQYANLFQSQLSSIKVTLDDVADQIANLDISKSYGADNISPIFIKEGGPVICNILHNLFQRSLNSAAFPNEWKKS